MGATDLRFNNKNKQFYTELKKRVDQYFTESQIKKTANLNMYLKSAVLISGYFAAYALITLHVFDSKLAWLLLSVLMGLFMACIGLSVMHDSNHGSFSRSKNLNKYMSFFSMNILGGHSLNWRIQHNVIHHNYTNVHAHDEDIAPPGFMRFEPHAHKKWIHKFQFLYAWFFYGLMTLMWCTVKDFKQIFRFNKRKLLGSKTNLRTELFVIILSKIGYFGYMLIPYFMVKEMTFLNWLTGFVVIHYIVGLSLAVIFQAAHVVEETEFPLPNDNGELQEHWAELQLKTTMNFAMDARIFSWFIGGLNFQVEHHLFPTICHVHYREISKIVKQTATDFNLPYNFQKTFIGAIGSHARLLYRLGRN